MRRELTIDVIQDMQEKINALKVPKGFAAVPVIFHISGASSSLETSDYFYRIIDISDFVSWAT